MSAHKTKPAHTSTSKHYHHNKNIQVYAQISRAPATTPAPTDAPSKHTKDATPYATPLDQQLKDATLA